MQTSQHENQTRLKLELNFVGTRKKTTKHKTNTHTHNDDKIKSADKANISSTRAKSTKIGLKETESNKVLTDVGSDGIDNTVVSCFFKVVQCTQN